MLVDVRSSGVSGCGVGIGVVVAPSSVCGRSGGVLIGQSMVSGGKCWGVV